MMPNLPGSQYLRADFRPVTACQVLAKVARSGTP